MSHIKMLSNRRRLLPLPTPCIHLEPLEITAKLPSNITHNYLFFCLQSIQVSQRNRLSKEYKARHEEIKEKKENQIEKKEEKRKKERNSLSQIIFIIQIFVSWTMATGYTIYEEDLI